MSDTECIARLVLRGAPTWTDHETNQVIAWLRNKASDLSRERKLYAKTFRAKYFRVSSGI
jgi:hypothetical protein